MKTLQDQELKQLKAGVSISSALLNSFNTLIKVLLDAGQRVGSALRRIEGESLCPLE